MRETVESHEAIGAFLAGWPLSGQWRWRALRVRASGQEALAFYSWDPESEAFERLGLPETLAG